MKKMLIISLILLFLMTIIGSSYAFASSSGNERPKLAKEYQDFFKSTIYSSEIAKLTKLSMIIQDSYNILIKNDFHTKKHFNS